MELFYYLHMYNYLQIYDGVHGGGAAVLNFFVYVRSMSATKENWTEARTEARTCTVYTLTNFYFFLLFLISLGQ